MCEAKLLGSLYNGIPMNELCEYAKHCFKAARSVLRHDWYVLFDQRCADAQLAHDMGDHNCFSCFSNQMKQIMKSIGVGTQTIPPYAMDDDKVSVGYSDVTVTSKLV